MNTPVGVCLTTVSFLAEKAQQITNQHEEKMLTAGQFEDYLENSRTSLGFTIKNLRRTANLVSSFKQLAMEQRNEPIQTFGFYEHLQDVISSLEYNFLDRRPDILVSGSSVLQINSFPGIWSQVLSSLVVNSVRHGFNRMDLAEGEIKISFELEGNFLLLHYCDNGCGMDEKQCEKIFDPFYTTSRGRGDIGLGMHIVFNIVNQVLGGSIFCHSQLGSGTDFFVRVPL